MNHLNSVLLEGNVCIPPEVKWRGESGVMVVFRVASNRFYRSKEKPNEWSNDTLYMSVQTWGELGERCIAALEKGTPVRIVGRLRGYVAKDSEGREIERTVILASHVEYKKRLRPQEENAPDDEITMIMEAVGDQIPEANEPMVAYVF